MTLKVLNGKFGMKAHRFVVMSATACDSHGGIDLQGARRSRWVRGSAVNSKPLQGCQSSTSRVLNITTRRPSISETSSVQLAFVLSSYMQCRFVRLLHFVASSPHRHHLAGSLATDTVAALCNAFLFNSACAIALAQTKLTCLHSIMARLECKPHRLQSTFSS